MQGHSGPLMTVFVVTVPRPWDRQAVAILWVNIRVRLMLTIGRHPYDPSVAGIIAYANGWRRLVRAVANASSLAVRTTTICS